MNVNQILIIVMIKQHVRIQLEVLIVPVIMDILEMELFVKV